MESSDKSSSKWSHEDDPAYTGDPATDRALLVAKAMEFAPGAPLSPQELRTEQARSLEDQARQIVAELRDALPTPAGEPVTVPAPAGLETSRWKAYNPTGAFDSAAVSFRFMPRAYSWSQVGASMFVLYGTFVGIPVAGGVWAAWRIGLLVGWW
jgi:hypothetical protein